MDLNDNLSSNLEQAVAEREAANTGAGERTTDGASISQDGGVGDAPAALEPTPAPEAAQSQSATTTAEHNDATPLSAALATKYGVRTVGELARLRDELESRYSESSREGKRLAEERNTMLERLQMYQEFASRVLAQQQQQAVQQQQPHGQQPEMVQAKKYFGFATKEALMAAYQADPLPTLVQAIRAGLLEDTDFRKAMVGPEVEPLQQAVKSTAEAQAAERQRQDNEGFLASMTERQSATFADYPEFAPGKPHHTALCKWWAENRDWEQRRAYQDPNYNPYKTGVKYVLAELHEAQLKAAKGKLDETRQRAVTARPGPGGMAVPKRGGSLSESAARIAADLNANGHSIDADAVARWPEALAEKLPFLR